VGEEEEEEEEEEEDDSCIKEQNQRYVIFKQLPFL
jgi:hypothetical protein